MTAIHSVKLFSSTVFKRHPGSVILLHYNSQTSCPSNLKYNAVYFNSVRKKILQRMCTTWIFPNVKVKSKPYYKPVIKSNFYYYVVNEGVAKVIVDKTKNFIRDENSIITECNPGLGLVTHFLIMSDVKKIKVFETSQYSREAFKQLLKKHSNIIELIDGNILNTYQKKKSIFMDLVSSSLESISRESLKSRTGKMSWSFINAFGSTRECFLVRTMVNSSGYETSSSVQFHEQKEKIIKLFGVINQDFLTHLIYIASNQNFRNAQENIELYVIISEPVYYNMADFRKCTGKFNSYCLINFFFTIELLEKFPRTAFLPLPENRDEKMYFVKLIGKKNCFRKIGEENLSLYVNFLKVLERSRHSLLIPTLEHWLPNCGPLLISKGISCTSQVEDFNAEESVILFNLCAKTEGFKNFKCLQRNFNRSEPTPEEDVEI